MSDLDCIRAKEINSYTEVNNVVIHIVNEIMANGLNHGRFRLLLDEEEYTF